MACEWFAAYVCGLCLPKESCSGLRLTAHDFSRIYHRGSVVLGHVLKP
jgi:hypothetical protein